MPPPSFINAARWAHLLKKRCRLERLQIQRWADLVQKQSKTERLTNLIDIFISGAQISEEDEGMIQIRRWAHLVKKKCWMVSWQIQKWAHLVKKKCRKVRIQIERWAHLVKRKSMKYENNLRRIHKINKIIQAEESFIHIRRWAHVVKKQSKHQRLTHRKHLVIQKSMIQRWTLLVDILLADDVPPPLEKQYSSDEEQEEQNQREQDEQDQPAVDQHAEDRRHPPPLCECSTSSDEEERAIVQNSTPIVQNSTPSRVVGGGGQKRSANGGDGDQAGGSKEDNTKVTKAEKRQLRARTVAAGRLQRFQAEDERNSEDRARADAARVSEQLLAVRRKKYPDVRAQYADVSQEEAASRSAARKAARQKKREDEMETDEEEMSLHEQDSHSFERTFERSLPRHICVVCDRRLGSNEMAHPHEEYEMSMPMFDVLRAGVAAEVVRHVAYPVDVKDYHRPHEHPMFKQQKEGNNPVQVCKSCSKALRGKHSTIPRNCVINGHNYGLIPPELDCLNDVELRMISLYRCVCVFVCVCVCVCA